MDAGVLPSGAQFYGGITPQVFSLTYNHIAGHSIEYRVNWSGIETAAVTGMLITNDLDGDQMCDCFSDTNGDGVCDCFSDLDGDEICDEEEISGCTDSIACNYDNTATDDDNSCVLATEY